MTRLLSWLLRVELFLYEEQEGACNVASRFRSKYESALETLTAEQRRAIWSDARLPHENDQEEVW